MVISAAQSKTTEIVLLFFLKVCFINSERVPWIYLSSDVKSYLKIAPLLRVFFKQLFTTRKEFNIFTMDGMQSVFTI
jgi:hypothetical protein